MRLTEVSRSRKHIILLHPLFCSFPDGHSGLPPCGEIDTALLDSTADTLAEIEDIADQATGIDELIIIDDRIKSPNPIIQNYSDMTLKAYVCLFHRYGIDQVTVAELSS
ncbi:MAG: hypothetical protein K5695_00185 [Oscillospiraceae bacterium]|nr:hypothetical protein [Oscillospiraceae bacterium]